MPSCLGFTDVPNRCPPGLGPSLAAGVVVTLSLIGLFARSTNRIGSHAYRGGGCLRTLLIVVLIAFELAAFTAFYHRYRRCDTATGFLLYGVVVSVVLIVALGADVESPLNVPLSYALSDR